MAVVSWAALPGEMLLDDRLVELLAQQPLDRRLWVILDPFEFLARPLQQTLIQLEWLGLPFTARDRRRATGTLTLMELVGHARPLCLIDWIGSHGRITAETRLLFAHSITFHVDQ